MWRSRFIFIVFCLTTLLVATVHLRTTSSRIFYSSRADVVRQDRLKQQLWEKQLMLAKLTNPSTLPDTPATE